MLWVGNYVKNKAKLLLFMQDFFLFVHCPLSVFAIRKSQEPFFLPLIKIKFNTHLSSPSPLVLGIIELLDALAEIFKQPNFERIWVQFEQEMFQNSCGNGQTCQYQPPPLWEGLWNDRGASVTSSEIALNSRVLLLSFGLSPIHPHWTSGSIEVNS